jgi:Flp pilus assembly pilin Flp
MRIATAVWSNTVGSTSIEYAFMACLIAIAAVGGMGLAGNAVGNTLTTASNQMSAAPALSPKG